MSADDVDLADLLGTQEGPTLEFKSTAKREGGRGDAIGKAVCAIEDRIEVTNPGGPFGQVRADNFDRVTDYRNPSLAAAMKGLGYVNRFGRGVGRVRKALENNGNPAAEFQVDDVSWAVVIRSAA
ncbi:ATP-binding protein [Streptomyces chumphonensis]|uniref:ATP-binding protein n=1 Tax=Streptomyces chumphonensis TaxID=1214925 RepID=UPI002964D380|nr:ATP-binding protein [Streptomyces chumphonensis]